MFDTALVMQQTDFAKANDTIAILEQTDLLLDIMDSHAHYEDDYILSAVEKHASQMIAELEGEHVTDLQLTENLRAKVAAYRNANSAEERFDLGFEIQHALNDFIAFNLTHMRKEETILNQVLWANYTDAEIIGMEVRIQQQIPPEKVFIYFEWMVKAINDTELIHWLSAVKNEAPDFIFNGLLQLCQDILPANRWAPLGQQLAEGEMV